MLHSLGLARQYSSEHRFAYDIVMVQRHDVLWYSDLSLHVDPAALTTATWAGAACNSEGR